MRLTRPELRPSGWWFDALLVGATAALTGALAAGWLDGLDTAVQDWCDAHRPRAAYWIARVLNVLGSGTTLTLICLAVALLYAVRRRSPRPVLPVVAAFLLTGFAILPLKLWTERSAPTSPYPDDVELFNDHGGQSYPSGHMVNTIVWYGVLALLLAGVLGPLIRRLLRIVPPVVVLGTTIYLSYHWLTDSVAGLLLGAVLYRLLARVPWEDFRPPSRS